MLSIPEAAKAANVDVKTIRRWIRKGAINAVKMPGGHYRIRVQDLGLAEPIRQSPKSGVYFIHAEDLSLVKIGASSDPNGRVSSLRGTMPFSIKLIGIIRRSDAFDFEATMHQRFQVFHFKGDWFKADAILLAEVGQILSQSEGGQIAS